MENDVLYNRIMNVVHKEYGDGSTAVANPTGEPTDALETIQIGDDVYSISGGSGALIAIASVDEQLNAIILDKTYNDIESAIIAKTPVYMYTELGGHSLVPIITAVHDSNGYSVVTSPFHGEAVTYISETADGVLVYGD